MYDQNISGNSTAEATTTELHVMRISAGITSDTHNCRTIQRCILDQQLARFRIPEITSNQGKIIGETSKSVINEKPRHQESHRARRARSIRSHITPMYCNVTYRFHHRMEMGVRVVCGTPRGTAPFRGKLCAGASFSNRSEGPSPYAGFPLVITPSPGKADLRS